MNEHPLSTNTRTHQIPPPQPITEIGEDEFDETYEPIPGPDGSDWREHYEIPDGTPVERVWTVVDADDGQYVMPGYHMVNYVARIVTENPWTDELLTVRIDSFECQECIDNPDLTEFVVTTANGNRMWHATDVEHAKEQHVDAFPD